MRILIVDDEPLVVRSLQRVLRMHAVTASSGPDAALKLISAGRCFDAVLCDLHMAGGSGIDFYRRLDALLPALAARVVFLAASTFTDEEEAFLRAHRHVIKPWTVADLADALAPLETS